METNLANRNSVIDTTSTIADVRKEKLRDLKLDILHQTRHDEKASHLYGFVQTNDILKVLVENGFHYALDDMKIKRGYKTSPDLKAHLVQLVHQDLSSFGNIDPMEGVPRIFLWNSYDRSKSLQFDIGYFRGFCWNTCVFGKKIHDTIRIVHKRSENNIDAYRAKIEQATKDIIKAFNGHITPLIGTLMSTEMTMEQQVDFAKRAFEARVGSQSFIEGDVEKILSNLGNIEKDEGNTLWQVFSKVQRNLGLNFRKEDFAGEITYKFNSTDKDGNDIVKSRVLSGLNEPIRVTDLNKQMMDLIVDYLPENEKKLLLVA